MTFWTSHMAIFQQPGSIAVVYAAAFTWLKLVTGISTNVWMLDHRVHDTTAAIQHHFWEKYLLGHTDARNLTLGGGAPGCTILLHESVVKGYGIVWMCLTWFLPAIAITLVLYSLASLAAESVWSFEDGNYLHFTWHRTRTQTYRWLVRLMIAAPFLLLVLWLFGAEAYSKSEERLDANFQIFQDRVLTILFLLLSLNFLANPSVPIHSWSREDMHRLNFHRSILHLIFGSNGNFGMKMTDALWTARMELEQNGTLSEDCRLYHYFKTPEDAQLALEICEKAQRAEASRKKKNA